MLSLFLALAGASSCPGSLQMLLHTSSEIFYLPLGSVQRYRIVSVTFSEVPSLIMHGSFDRTLLISSEQIPSSLHDLHSDHFVFEPYTCKCHRWTNLLVRCGMHFAMQVQGSSPRSCPTFKSWLRRRMVVPSPAWLRFPRLLLSTRIRKLNVAGS